MPHDNQECRDAERTVVITGGSSGLGHETAKAILQSTEDWHVVIASRDERRTTDAVERLVERTEKQAITPMTLDLGSTDTVREFVDELAHRVGTGTLPPVHAVVCNAGIQKVTGTDYTDDGFEATFGVNHLGHFLLVNLVIEHVTAPARFVFLAGAGTGSNGHARDSDQGLVERATGVVPPRTDFENIGDMVYPDDEATTDAARVGMQRYTTSKLANVLTAFEFDRRLRENGLSTPSAPVTSNAFNPGLLPGTGLARDRSPIQQFIWNSVMPALSLLPSHATVGQRGRDLAHLVTDPTLEAVSGVYFEGRRVARPHPAARDDGLAETLWQASADLVGINGQEI